MWQKIISFFTMIFQFIASLFGFTPVNPPVKPAVPDTAYIDSFIESESDYILSLVLENGAVCMTVPMFDYSLDAEKLPECDGISAEEYTRWNTAIVNPYFAATAIEGLIKASPSKAASVAQKFILWYISMLNTKETDYNGLDGTIYDYRVFIDPNDSSHILQISQRDMHAADFAQGGNIYGYDSTDSYAALFLRVLAAYAAAYSDISVLTSNKADIIRIFRAILATYSEQAELTFAKPDYAMCYLMDNCEVYAGLLGVARLFSLLGDGENAEIANSKADSIKNGIESVFYNRLTGHYHTAAGIDGKAALEATNTALNTFYPQGAAQLFPIIFGAIDSGSERAVAVYSDFCSRYVGGNASVMDWTEMRSGSFPWTVLLRACAIMEDYDTLSLYLDNLKSAYLDNGHLYPYYNAEAGSVLLALSEIK